MTCRGLPYDPTMQYVGAPVPKCTGCEWGVARPIHDEDGTLTMVTSPPAADVVLYVDDEEMARKYFERTFSGQYRVLTAADADTALGIVQDPETHVGIVVSDYRMPGRSGGDLLRQIADRFPHIIRLLVTAYADREVLLDTVNTGEVFRILEKPLDYIEVGKALRLASEALRTRNARRQRLQAIDETLSFLAHELNTPLATILNFARGLQDRLKGSFIPPQQQTEMLSAAGSVADNARYCLTLLSSFVETVRNTDSRLPDQRVSSAHELVRSFLDTYPLTSGQRSMIRVDVAGDFTISALPDCVSLVLSSLLSNSLRAVADSGSPAIRFTVAGGAQPSISVTDNGPGIPPEILGRLTIDPVTTYPDSGGTGWGLIFCKRIMQAFGGTIAIRSEPGAGATVVLNFPPVTTKELEIR